VKIIFIDVFKNSLSEIELDNFLIHRL
jgi:hypothetical protein